MQEQVSVSQYYNSLCMPLHQNEFGSCTIESQSFLEVWVKELDIYEAHCAFLEGSVLCISERSERDKERLHLLCLQVAVSLA